MTRPTQMNAGRRRFLIGAGALAATATIPNALFAYTGGSSRLVIVILRGALDGLAAVPPYGDPDYASLHRELAIAAPGAASESRTSLCAVTSDCGASTCSRRVTRSASLASCSIEVDS